MAIHHLPSYIPNKTQLKGLFIVAFFSLICVLVSPILQQFITGISSLIVAILLGVVLGNVFNFDSTQGKLANSMAGFEYCKNKLLRTAIVLYGFKITLSQIVGLGISTVLIDFLLLTSTFTFCYLVGVYALKMDKQEVLLMGTGASICGAAAIIASEPVIKAPAYKVTIAVATVVIFGSLAMLVYPYLYQLGWLQPWLDSQSYGVYIGSSVHEVAQVVVAGHAIAEETTNTAVITKMIRVMMLAPFLLVLSVSLSMVAHAKTAHKTGHHFGWHLLRDISIPWFAFCFIGVIFLNSWIQPTQGFVDCAVWLDDMLLTMAMFALGITTKIDYIKQAGVKPLLLGGFVFLWLIIAGGLINVLVYHCT